jgi:hypothetical protein
MPVSRRLHGDIEYNQEKIASRKSGTGLN